MVRMKANFAEPSSSSSSPRRGSGRRAPFPQQRTSEHVNGNFLAEMGDTNSNNFRTFMRTFTGQSVTDLTGSFHGKVKTTLAESAEPNKTEDPLDEMLLATMEAGENRVKTQPPVGSSGSQGEVELSASVRHGSWGGRLSRHSAVIGDVVVEPKAPCRISPWRIQLLKRFGVNIGKNGHTVLSYNPRIVQSGGNIIVVMCLLPRIFTRTLGAQWIALCFMAEAYALWCSYGDNEGDAVIRRFSDTVQGLTRFVLGLFVSLVLAKTYYANRGEFGTVFGRTMGFAQMVTAWVRMPLNFRCPNHARRVQLDARHLLVRWANAAFRLMVLEARDVKPEQIGQNLMQRELLSEAEWNHVAGLKSRATHVYQWMNNVVHDLQDAGYIRNPIYVMRMNTHIDDMRAANVWGLPSLPIMYTILITIMVKLSLSLLAFNQGSRLKCFANLRNGGALFGVVAGSSITGMSADSNRLIWAHMELVLSMGMANLLYQGLIDIHEVLFHPNQGTEVSHMPSDNFLDFVETVTTDLIAKNESLPYPVGSHEDGMGTPVWAGLLASEAGCDKAG